MKRNQLLILYLFSFFLFSCSQDDGKLSFHILQVNDVYEIAAIQNEQFGGMARVETVKQELLKKNKNTLLMIAGDFLNPSLLGTMKYEGKRISGRQMVDVMNAMEFDLAAFGNHEFDVKESELQERLNESNFPWISANIQHVTENDTIPFYQERNGVKEEVKGSFIKELTDEDGTTIKVGFLSVCIPSNPKSFVYYTDIYEEIQEEYDLIKDEVDVVIGLTHVEVGQDEEIAKLLPNIPLIMGGHEHTKKDRMVGNVSIKKADANAKSAYIHTINVDQKAKKTTVSSEYKMIDSSIAYEPKVDSLVNEWQCIMKKQISKVVDNPDCVIYNAEVPLDGKDTPTRSVQTNLGEMTAQSMAFSYNDKVDCAFINGGAIRIDDELTGDITSVDIFRVLPYGGSALKVDMPGSLLGRVLEYGETKGRGKGAYLQRYNAEKVDGVWRINNKKIVANKMYSVAISDYLLLGFDIPFLTVKAVKDAGGKVYKPKEGELAYDMRKGLIEYMKLESKRLKQTLPDCVVSDATDCE
jgi:2',3'-cyclic-nucleotide 2'-phosphodiesterase (5'-nucleotidase family)